MAPINPDRQRILDMFSRLGFDEGQPRPAPSPHESTIGTRNPALAELKRRPHYLNARQNKLVDDLDTFYQNTEQSMTNLELGYDFPSHRMSSLSSEQRQTLQRRASFLLNNDVMEALPDALEEVMEDGELLPTAKLELNAILNSAKSHTEHVMAAAREDARVGARVCPLMFQPVNFPVFLTTNSIFVRNVISACRLPQPARDRALKPALEGFARMYFSYSMNHLGAPKIQPKDFEIVLNSSESSSTSTDDRGNLTARLVIDSADAEQVCRSLQSGSEPDTVRDLFRSYMMKGFESHPLDQKLGAFYTQSLFQELAELQEITGAESADRPEHTLPARHAARRTLEEWEYKGSENFGDVVESQPGDQLSQRERTTAALQILTNLDDACIETQGTPLINMPEVRSWAHSPAMHFDLRALREPSARLLLQVQPLTGRALLDLPEFR